LTIGRVSKERSMSGYRRTGARWVALGSLGMMVRDSKPQKR
jgi:hypothetical protein